MPDSTSPITATSLGISEDDFSKLHRAGASFYSLNSGSLPSALQIQGHDTDLRVGDHLYRIQTNDASSASPASGDDVEQYYIGDSLLMVARLFAGGMHLKDAETGKSLLTMPKSHLLGQKATHVTRHRLQYADSVVRAWDKRIKLGDLVPAGPVAFDADSFARYPSGRPAPILDADSFERQPLLTFQRSDPHKNCTDEYPMGSNVIRIPIVRRKMNSEMTGTVSDWLAGIEGESHSGDVFCLSEDLGDAFFGKDPSQFDLVDGGVRARQASWTDLDPVLSEEFGRVAPRDMAPIKPRGARMACTLLAPRAARGAETASSRFERVAGEDTKVKILSRKGQDPATICEVVLASSA